MFEYKKWESRQAKAKNLARVNIGKEDQQRGGGDLPGVVVSPVQEGHQQHGEQARNLEVVLTKCRSKGVFQNQVHDDMMLDGLLTTLAELFGLSTMQGRAPQMSPISAVFPVGIFSSLSRQRSSKQNFWKSNEGFK